MDRLNHTVALTAVELEGMIVLVDFKETFDVQLKSDIFQWGVLHLPKMEDRVGAMKDKLIYSVSDVNRNLMDQ